MVVQSNKHSEAVEERALQELEAAMQLQRAMNNVNRDPVLPKGEHSDFDLSWMKKPQFNRAKAQNPTGQKGRGRGRKTVKIPESNDGSETRS